MSTLGKSDTATTACAAGCALRALVLLCLLASAAPGQEPKPDREALTQELSDPDPKVRSDAARRLAALYADAESALPQLIETLRTDSSALVRREAARAIGCVGPAAAPAVPALTEALACGEEWQVAVPAVIEALGDIGPRASSAAPALLDLASTRIDEWASVSSALSRLGPGAYPLLIEALALGESDALRWWVAECALAYSGAEATEFLLEATHDARSRVRERAACLLGRMWDATGPVALRLAELLSDRDQEVCR